MCCFLMSCLLFCVAVRKVPEVESKVAALVISNHISARIDSTNATLHAKHTEQRGVSCRLVRSEVEWNENILAHIGILTLCRGDGTVLLCMC